MKIKTFGLALLLSLACGACGASAALAAAPGAWKLAGKEILVGSAAFKASGTIELKERSYGEGTFTCTFEQAGKVGPGLVGEITSDKTSHCNYVGGSGSLCESAVELQALHLPWKTEAPPVNGTLRDKILEGGGGQPLWWLKCKGSTGTYENDCQATTSMSMTTSAKAWWPRSTNSQPRAGAPSAAK
jgi:hypothetical protein